ncbi:uncharacterized protein [Montipora capricornis]|uniref:uncharacterized protein n=1 Tax=Montipora capricornis TaxID=246305 RepID=UPI0035F1B350
MLKSPRIKTLESFPKLSIRSGKLFIQSAGESGGISYQTGKMNMSQTFQHWSCSRACSLPPSCRLPRCTNVQFPRPFGGSSNIRVYVSMSHGEKFILVHSPSSVWVQSINISGFEICAREAGINRNESRIVNWLAFQDQLQLSHGSVALSGIWTTETKCNKVTFTQSFASRPYVFISAKYFRNTKPEDAMYVWLENLSSRGFEVCLREFLAFDGKHQDTIVVSDLCYNCCVVEAELRSKYHAFSWAEVNLRRNGFEGDWPALLTTGLSAFAEDDGGSLREPFSYSGIRISEPAVVLAYKTGWVSCEAEGAVVWVVAEVEAGEDDGETMVGVIFSGRSLEGEISMGLSDSVTCWDTCFDFEQFFTTCSLELLL